MHSAAASPAPFHIVERASLCQCGSSLCSEGGLSASWTSASSAEKEASSGNESWETLPGFESEPEGQSDGGSLDDVTELRLVSP